MSTPIMTSDQLFANLRFHQPSTYNDTNSPEKENENKRETVKQVQDRQRRDQLLLNNIRGLERIILGVVSEYAEDFTNIEIGNDKVIVHMGDGQFWRLEMRMLNVHGQNE